MNAWREAERERVFGKKSVLSGNFNGIEDYKSFIYAKCRRSGGLGRKWGLLYKDTPRAYAHGNAKAQAVPRAPIGLETFNPLAFRISIETKSKGKSNAISRILLCVSIYTTKTIALFSKFKRQNTILSQLQ